MGKMRLRFTVVSETLKGQQCDCDPDQPITVGRTSDNALVLNHKSVSRRHARIESNSGSLVLIDLNSHNGTRVGDQLITERIIRPGETLGFGEVNVQLTDIEGTEDEATASAAELPAIVGDQAQAAPLARPLSLDEVFAQAAPTQAMPTAKARPLAGSLLYGLTLVTVVVLGLVGLWFVGRRPPGPRVLSVQLRVGEVLPVNLAPRADPTGQGSTPGLARVNEIDSPDDERVAKARPTSFSTVVTVRGLSVGTTDIVLHGPGTSRLNLRVLVRGVKPEPEAEAWLRALPKERRQRATELIERARLAMRRTGVVDERTTDAIRDLEMAAKLLEAIPGEGARIAATREAADKLRQARRMRFDGLAKQIDLRHGRGELRKCVNMLQELMRIFHEPTEAEYHIVRSFYEGVTEEMAREEREAREKS